MKFGTALLIILIIVAVIVFIRIIYELNHLTLKRYQVSSQKIKSDENLRLAYVVDLHNKNYGDRNKKLARMVSSQHPDAIIIGGDMITARTKGSDENAINALERLSEIAPVYYAPGNHELFLKIDKKLSERCRHYRMELDSMDVCYLENRKIPLTENIELYGLDIDQKYYNKFGHREKLTSRDVRELLGNVDKDKFNILLAHTPEFFKAYSGNGYDLVLSGHYHGGVIRLPNGKGLITPKFEFFPKHCGGAYRSRYTNMIVSRGAGSHGLGIRLNNEPEILIIDIKKA